MLQSAQIILLQGKKMRSGKPKKEETTYLEKVAHERVAQQAESSLFSLNIMKHLPTASILGFFSWALLDLLYHTIVPRSDRFNYDDEKQSWEKSNAFYAEFVTFFGTAAFLICYLLAKRSTRQDLETAKNKSKQPNVQYLKQLSIRKKQLQKRILWQSIITLPIGLNSTYRFWQEHQKLNALYTQLLNLFQDYKEKGLKESSELGYVTQATHNIHLAGNEKLDLLKIALEESREEAHLILCTLALGPALISSLYFTITALNRLLQNAFFQNLKAIAAEHQINLSRITDTSLIEFRLGEKHGDLYKTQFLAEVQKAFSLFAFSKDAFIIEPTTFMRKSALKKRLNQIVSNAKYRVNALERAVIHMKHLPLMTARVLSGEWNYEFSHRKNGDCFIEYKFRAFESISQELIESIKEQIRNIYGDLATIKVNENGIIIDPKKEDKPRERNTYTAANSHLKTLMPSSEFKEHDNIPVGAYHLEKAPSAPKSDKHPKGKNKKEREEKPMHRLTWKLDGRELVCEFSDDGNCDTEVFPIRNLQQGYTLFGYIHKSLKTPSGKELTQEESFLLKHARTRNIVGEHGEGYKHVDASEALRDGLFGLRGGMALWKLKGGGKTRGLVEKVADGKHPLLELNKFDIQH
jgi:hypothetical protein